MHSGNGHPKKYGYVPLNNAVNAGLRTGVVFHLGGMAGPAAPLFARGFSGSGLEGSFFPVSQRDKCDRNLEVGCYLSGEVLECACRSSHFFRSVRK